MAVLRIILYLVCLVSIGWSVLVFGGPPILKRLISEYSDGAFMPSGISVSPSLNIRISRLDFSFQSQTAGRPIEGFSRATEIVWSLFGQKPFLEINLGPSVFKDLATAKSLYIYTPSLQEIDWKSILVAANVDSLAINSFAKTHSLTLEGNINLEVAKISAVNLEAKNFYAVTGASTYFADIIKGKISEFNLNIPAHKQQFSSSFEVENIRYVEPGLTSPEASFTIDFAEKSRAIEIDLHDVMVSDFGGFAKNVKVDGTFNQSNDLKELNIGFFDGFLFSGSPKFPEISATVNKLDDDFYIEIEGDLGDLELSRADYFIGSLPSSNFVIDLELDTSSSKMSSISKINVPSLSEIGLNGFIEMEFGSDLVKKLNCAIPDCELSDFVLNYRMNLADEWVQGSGNCPKNLCKLSELDHFVQTSNTVNIFETLNQAGILNPLSSLYLYTIITSGQKMNGGHELKFQF